MFQRLEPADRSVTIYFDGRPHRAAPGDSVAAALLQAGVTSFRKSAVSGSNRLAHCMIGVCFECLLKIDGVADRQACLIEVRDGMQIGSQTGPTGSRGS